MSEISCRLHVVACFFLLTLAVGCATHPPQDGEAAAPSAKASSTETKPAHGSAQASHKQGNALFDEGRYAEAKAAYEEALRLDPKHQAACANLALCLKRMGRIPEALKTYQEALALDPKDTQTHENYVYALEDSGRLDEAAKELRILAAELPDDAYTLKHLATILVYLDKNEEAVDFYEKAFKLKPGEANDYYNLGLCYFNLEKWDSALTTWLTALAHDSKHPAANKGMAVAYWKRGDYEKAWEAVSQCGALGIVVDAAFLAALEKDSGKRREGVPPTP